MAAGTGFEPRRGHTGGEAGRPGDGASTAGGGGGGGGGPAPHGGRLLSSKSPCGGGGGGGVEAFSRTMTCSGGAARGCCLSGLVQLVERVCAL